MHAPLLFPARSLVIIATGQQKAHLIIACMAYCSMHVQLSEVVTKARSWESVQGRLALEALLLKVFAHGTRYTTRIDCSRYH